MLIQHIALVPEVTGIDPSELARVSAALQKQVVRDFSPIWGISATVDPFPRLEDVPVGYWPIIVAFGELGTDEGIHLDDHGQPYALIEMSPSWSLTASHVCLEMLVDPFGCRTVAGASPRSDQGGVEFLLEVCDPCGDALHGYAVNDVLVSDFCTPDFLSEAVPAKGRYSFTGAIEAPYQVLAGGRLTWYDPTTSEWWQRHHVGGSLRDTDLGLIERRLGRIREIINPDAPQHLAPTKMSLEAYEQRIGIARQRALRASQAQAHLLRVHLADPSGRRELQLQAQRRSVVEPVRSGASFPERPQVLAALLRASIGPAKAIDFDDSIRRASDPANPTRHPSALSQRPEATRPAERRPSIRRTTLPPPLPRSAHAPHRPAPERVAARHSAPPSLAPTAMPAAESVAPRTQLVRDRMMLVGAVAAAGLAAVAFYGSSAPGSEKVRAAAPAVTIAPLVEASLAPAAPPTDTGAEATSPHTVDEPVPRASSVEPPPATPVSKPSAPAHRTTRVRAAPTAAAKGTTPSPAAADPDDLDALVEERR